MKTPALLFLIFAVSLQARAANSENAAVTSPAVSVSSAADPIGEWIDQNADRLGLIPGLPKNASKDASAVTSKAVSTTDASSVTPAPGANDAAAQIAAGMEKLKYGPKCLRFASTNGFGTWGQLIIDQLQNGKANALLKGTDDLRRACPNYDDLGTTQKTYVWVKVFATLAFRESSCEPKIKGKGPNGDAVGLLQLHLGHEHNAAPGCNRNDALSAMKSLRCGISILKKQIEGSGRLFDRETHFGVLRPQGDWVNGRRVYLAKLTVKALQQLPFCQKN